MLKESERMQTPFFIILIVGVLTLMVFVLLPYLSALFLALILSIMFRPVFQYINARLRRPGAASLITVLIVLLVIILPLILFSVLVFNEAYGLYTNGTFEFSNSDSFLGRVNLRIENFFSKISPRVTFDLQLLTERVFGWFVNNLSNFFSGFVDAVIGLFIATLGLFYLFRDGGRVIKRLMYLSPLSDKYDEEIFEKIENAINSVVRGSLVVAIIQGFLSGIGFLIFGVPNAILWASVATLTSLIPTVGTSVVLIPSILYLFFAGHTLSALGLLLWGAIAVGLVDNFLGPHFIERGIKIHPFLILLSVIGGITFFGPIGFIAGPVILSLLFALLDIYPSIARRTYRG